MVRGLPYLSTIGAHEILQGSTDGSLTSLTYVDEQTSKTLHLLQGQLTRNVQHVAGLNPKAFRYVSTSYPKRNL